MSHGGEYFFRFVRLGVLAGFVYYGIYRFSAWLFRRIERATQDVTVEESVLAYVVVASLGVVFLLTFANMAFDYAKIATYRENRRSMVLAAVKGFGFVLSHLGRLHAAASATLRTVGAGDDRLQVPIRRDGHDQLVVGDEVLE